MEASGTCFLDAWSLDSDLFFVRQPSHHACSRVKPSHPPACSRQDRQWICLSVGDPKIVVPLKTAEKWYRQSKTHPHYPCRGATCVLCRWVFPCTFNTIRSQVDRWPLPVLCFEPFQLWSGLLARCPKLGRNSVWPSFCFPPQAMFCADGTWSK